MNKSGVGGGQQSQNCPGAIISAGRFPSAATGRWATPHHTAPPANHHRARSPLLPSRSTPYAVPRTRAVARPRNVLTQGGSAIHTATTHSADCPSSASSPRPPERRLPPHHRANPGPSVPIAADPGTPLCGLPPGTRISDPPSSLSTSIHRRPAPLLLRINKQTNRRRLLLPHCPIPPEGLCVQQRIRFVVSARLQQPQGDGARRGMRDDGPAAALVPRLAVSSASRVEELERFSHYVARQIGFDHASECPHLCTLAYDYLRKNKGYEDNIFAFFQHTADPESLIVKFIEELDKCILGYFSFHWKCSTYMITQVLTVEGAPKRKLRNMVLEVTRSQRFERVTRNLKVTRLFSTLVEELKAIGLSPPDQAQCSDVMVPVAHCDRSPVLLLMGGGMGAGKSTVLKDILKEPFWSGAAANAVVVEADAFKETDVIYRAISSRGHHNDMLQTAELVHQSSMDAASSLLVTALNEGRDVIMDGTLSWEPFFQQTVAMARAVSRQRYRMGVGYKVTEDGSITEDYWEPVEACSTDEEIEMRSRKPYRIELVGVVCDAYLAVVRGIRRAVITGRAVRVKSQLQSHRRFASAFRGYCGVVDNARLYCTNSMGAPKLIGWKDGESNLLVDPEEIGCLERVSGLNDEANCVDELYPAGEPSPSAWQDLVASPSRASVQRELRAAVQTSEARFRAASLADGALRGGDAPVQTF